MPAFEFLLNLPEGTNTGTKVNDAMRGIERDNPHLAARLVLRAVAKENIKLEIFGHVLMVVEFSLT